MNYPRVIGISGKIGHGKDTIAAYLAQNHGYQVVRFSDALKEEVHKRLNRTLKAHVRFAYNHEPTDSEIWELLTVRRDPVTRALLQEYGTEIRRADDENYWTKRWLENAWRYERVAVPDVRFPNELQAVRALKGKVLLVNRVGMPDTGDHASENSLNQYQNWDKVFTNHYLTDLYTDVEDWIRGVTAATQ